MLVGSCGRCCPVGVALSTLTNSSSMLCSVFFLRLGVGFSSSRASSGLCGDAIAMQAASKVLFPAHFDVVC